MKNLKKTLLSIIIPSFLIYNTCNPIKDISSAPKGSLQYYKDVLNEFSDVVKSIKYVSDYKTYGKRCDYWQTPLQTIKRKEGNCSDKMILLNSLVKDKIDIKPVFGRYKIADTVAHAWQQFKVKNDIYVVESSNKLNIYKKDSLLKADKNILYRPIEGNKTFQKKIYDFQKKTGIKLDFKYYE